MHKLNRPATPLAFTAAVTALLPQYPPAASGCSENDRWDALRNTQQAGYKAAHDALATNQGGLCAYCEIQLSTNHSQIEHFKPKSMTTPTNDLTFSLPNFLVCCNGGTYPHTSVPGEYCATPSAKANHTCGAHKEDTDPATTCLDPYTLPDFPLFKVRLTSEGIALDADEAACQRAGIGLDLVKSTLNCLNLNCVRLCSARSAVWKIIEEEILEVFSLSSDQQISELNSIVSTYSQPTQPFYTTALLCLAEYDPHWIS
jgi:uncharacterized protein (TIGR02646 family)